MDIQISPLIIGLAAAWFVLGFIVIVYLAPRKTTQPLITIVAATIALLVPVIGLVMILYLFFKDPPEQSAPPT